jgi:CubicO group peptidase (beta-lactamase class C family)
MQQVHRAAPSQYDCSSGRLTAGGYGFGLSILHDLRFGHVVGHPGGLPGFGSYMRWLPDRGVGVVALANVTYAPMALATLEALEVLDDLGALTPRPTPPVSTGILAARDLMLRLIEGWDDERARELFAVNVFLDLDRDRRRAELEAVRHACGSLSLDDAVVMSATRATFRLHGERRDAKLHLMLTPEVPPQLEWYSVEIL